MTPTTYRPLSLALTFVLALGLLGCGDTEDQVANPIDTTPPSIPVSLTLTASSDVVHVTWQENSELDLAGYVLQRSLDQGETWDNVSGTLLETAEWDDPTASRIDYRVSAVDLSNNQSAFSQRATYISPTGGPKYPARPY